MILKKILLTFEVMEALTGEVLKITNSEYMQEGWWPILKWHSKIYGEGNGKSLINLYTCV